VRTRPLTRKSFFGGRMLRSRGSLTVLQKLIELLPTIRLDSDPRIERNWNGRKALQICLKPPCDPIQSEGR
jgi:hypothetical protein